MSKKENGRKFLFKKRRPGGGRKSIAQLHPEVVSSAEEYIRQNSFAADARRRTTTGQACGVTLRNIKSYLEEAHQFEVSTSTIHRWMNPPRKQKKDIHSDLVLEERKLLRDIFNEQQQCSPEREHVQNSNITPPPPLPESTPPL